MVTGRIGFALLAYVTLCAGAGLAPAAPPPKANDILQFKPMQAGVLVSTPTDAEAGACTVEALKGTRLSTGKTSGGWVLKDGQGRTLRRFFDSDGDGVVDIRSYYLDGQEAYREADSNYDGKMDQFRWLGANGSKWGVDLDGNGTIDTWRVISAEEVSQELLSAVAKKDSARLQALLITKAEMDALDLPEAEASRIRASIAGAQAKFQKTTTAVSNLTDKTQWIHLETAVPQTIAADTLGAKYDLTRHKHGTILYENGGKHDFLQTGEIILVGRAWRLIDGPMPGARSDQAAAGTAGLEVPETIKSLVEELKKVDEKAPKAGSKAEDVAQYNLARAAVLEKIVAALQGEAQTDWVKQLADCLGAAAQAGAGDSVAYQRLSQLQAQVTKTNPGSALAAYVVFREMSADYTRKLGTTGAAKMTELQEGWRERLAKFVADYPTAEDTPDALMQLGMVSEFMGKETEAKNWYKQLAEGHKQNPLAAKAQGAMRRLTLEGQDLDLAATTLSGNAFDVKTLKGKLVVVYYWASWNSQCAADFAKLKAIQAALAGKGVELVTVNLDNTSDEATALLRQHQLGGTHLYQTGGLESPLAVNYGVFVLPNLFIVGTDGKVASRNAQIATLEDDLRKLLK